MDEVDKLVLEILGEESAAVQGLDVSESMTFPSISGAAEEHANGNGSTSQYGPYMTHLMNSPKKEYKKTKSRNRPNKDEYDDEFRALKKRKLQLEVRKLELEVFKLEKEYPDCPKTHSLSSHEYVAL